MLYESLSAYILHNDLELQTLSIKKYRIYVSFQHCFVAHVIQIRYLLTAFGIESTEPIKIDTIF